jgi:hypothetical protein
MIREAADISLCQATLTPYFQCGMSGGHSEVHRLLGSFDVGVFLLVSPPN